NLGGAYYCLDCEMNVPDGCTLMTTTTTRPVAFINFAAWGDAVGEFDDKGFLFHVDGLTDAAGHLLCGNTLRVNIGGSLKYLVMSDTEDSLTINDLNFGSRTAGDGIDLGSSEAGVVVAAQYTDSAVLANTTDYVGCAGIFDLKLGRAITLASGGGYGFASLWANVELDEDINATGATSAAWFSVWADASKDFAGTTRIQGVDIAIVTGAGEEFGASTKLYGLRIDSSVNASTTVDGEFAAINIEAAGTKKDWTIGIDVNDAATGIDIAAASTTHGINSAADINVGSRVAGSGIDLGTWTSGILVAAQYTDAAVLANDYDYCGMAGIFDLTIGRAITLASGGGYGWSAINGSVTISKAIASTGGLSAGWFAIWAEASGADAALTESTRIQAVDAAIVTGSSFNAGASTAVYGVRVDSSVHASATVSGAFAGIHIGTGSGKKPWTMALSITGGIGAATGRAISSVVTQNITNHGDGYGANEFDLTITGTSAGHVAALSSWVNGTSGTHGTGGVYINAASLGVYFSGGATITAARVNFGFRASYQGGQSPNALHLISYSSPGVDITSMFHIGQFHSNVGVVASGGDTGGSSAYVKFMSDDGGNVKYIRLYDGTT
ncbi:MAG: hypothetical protein KKC55_15800, partial [Gammaproteobacteria bacterium]|nr:hypothetical protein [Gammaproteobacteria bacterium]